MKKPSSRCLTSRNWCLNIDERMALVVDPMLATGGSMIATTIDLLKSAGCTSIKVLVLVARFRKDCRAGESPPGR